MKDIGISTLDIYLTGICNYKCEYCYGEDDSQPHMKDSVYVACLDFAEYIGADTIEICGGEPLMSPYFYDAVKKAKQRGFKLILRTNGIFLGDYIDFVAENFDWVGISLDGLSAVNSEMRPSKARISSTDKFNIPIENISKLKKANPNIKILLATVASAVNHKEVPAFAEYIEACDLQIDKWKIYQFINDKFRSKVNNDKFSLQQSDFDKLREILPRIINNRVEVIPQSSNVEGASGNCLIVFSNGTLKVMDENFGKIGEDSHVEISSRLSSSKVVNYIKVNKLITYK